jgi:hypothetical protein
MINTGNKYKCFIQHDGANYMGVNLVKPITISGKKDDQSFRYARKSSVWKFARYENVALYDAIKLLLLTPSTLANEILVKCELWDNWIAMTEVVYTGYVPLSGIAINLKSLIMIGTTSIRTISMTFTTKSQGLMKCWGITYRP